MRTRSLIAMLIASGAAAAAFAAPVTYTIDPQHTYPSFEAPHIEGISIWRGKLDHTLSGTIVLDRQARTGSVDIVMDAGSIDFGNPALNEHMKTADFFDVAKYPTITYKADRMKFDGDRPVEVDGVLTLHGVSRPVVLKIDEFKCILHPMFNREVCGADATAEINRSDFGMSLDVKMTGDWVHFQIQVEALKTD